MGEKSTIPITSTFASLHSVLHIIYPQYFLTTLHTHTQKSKLGQIVNYFNLPVFELRLQQMVMADFCHIRHQTKPIDKTRIFCIKLYVPDHTRHKATIKKLVFIHSFKSVVPVRQSERERGKNQFSIAITVTNTGSVLYLQVVCYKYR